MWVMLNDSFLSIVEDSMDRDRDTMSVRARWPGDIERVFPNADVIQGAGTDYEYRAYIGRGEVAKAMADAVEAIDYTNFKDTIEKADPKNGEDRHDAYLQVWSTLMRYTLKFATTRLRPSRQRTYASEPYGNWWETYREDGAYAGRRDSRDYIGRSYNHDKKRHAR